MEKGPRRQPSEQKPRRQTTEKIGDPLDLGFGTVHIDNNRLLPFTERSSDCTTVKRLTTDALHLGLKPSFISFSGPLQCTCIPTPVCRTELPIPLVAQTHGRGRWG